MKRVNVLYLAIVPCCFILFQMNAKLGKASAFFYGFAENKETELSHDQPVLIHKILVTPGQKVKKGQLLMEVKQSSIDLKIDNASLDLERLQTIALQEKQKLVDRMEQLKVKRSTKVSALTAEIHTLEATINYNQNLLEGLKSIDTESIDPTNTPNAIKLQTLKESLRLTTEPIDTELAQLEKKLVAILKPAQVQRQKLQGEIDFYKIEQSKLDIVAPSNGLIGNILCKEGENISAFSKMINFYEPMPTMVKGFVHESLILQVKEGDSLIVSSSLHPAQKIKGKIIGLGSRIVEIPERLRKIPDFKTYGREVLIRIPSNNPFLQKEKVMLNSLLEKEDNSFSLAGVFSLFRTGNKDKNKKITNSILSK